MDLLVVGGAKKVHQGFEEASIDDRRFIKRMDRDVADTCDSGEDEREVGGLQKAKEWGKTLGPHDFELVFLVGCKVSEGEGGLALDLGR